MIVEYRIAAAKPFADPRSRGHNMYFLYIDSEGAGAAGDGRLSVR